MKRSTLIGGRLLFFLFLPLAVFAQEDAGQPGAFMRYGVGGRALGMGRAFSALANDASSIYWNPAGMLGVTRFELTSMYSDLYYDSRFAYMGFVVPRPGSFNLRQPFLRALFGPNTAFGIGWVGLSSIGFEQRTSLGERIGDFSIGEDAFLFAWAREELWDWGLLRYGFNVKILGQNFSGLESSGSAQFNRDWSWGMDMGLIYQPFHTPFIKSLPSKAFKYVLPLRFALVIQNFIQPGLNSETNDTMRFPRVVRFGLKYTWIFKDWLPLDFLRYSEMVSVFDLEWIKGVEAGKYFGVEGNFRFTKNGFALLCRTGLNNRTEGLSLGAGLSIPIAEAAKIRMDYAYGFHPYLPEDNRFFLTFEFGKSRGSSYFLGLAEQDNIRLEERRDLLRKIILEYNNPEVPSAADLLATHMDTTYRTKYIQLTSGLLHANYLFDEAKDFLNIGKIKPARDRARDANKYYAQVKNIMSMEDSLNWAESMIISGNESSATQLLESMSSTETRRYFLQGVGYKALGNWEKSSDAFLNVMGIPAQDAERFLKDYESLAELENVSEVLNQYVPDPNMDPQNIVAITTLSLAEVWHQMGGYSIAQEILEIVLKKYTGKLVDNYPRYPIFKDQLIVDDAQFLYGINQIKNNQIDEGIVSLLNTLRLYPKSEYGLLISVHSQSLINMLKKKDLKTLNDLVNQFMYGDGKNPGYLEVHNIK